MDLPPQINGAVEKIQVIFGSKSKHIDPKAVKNLRADLEKQLGSSRSDWETPLFLIHSNKLAHLDLDWV